MPLSAHLIHVCVHIPVSAAGLVSAHHGQPTGLHSRCTSPTEPLHAHVAPFRGGPASGQWTVTAAAIATATAAAAASAASAPHTAQRSRDKDHV